MFLPSRTRLSSFFAMFALAILVIGGIETHRGVKEHDANTAFIKTATKVTADVVGFQAQSDPCGSDTGGNHSSCWDIYYSVSYVANGQPETANVTISDVDQGRPQPARPATLDIYYKNDKPAVAEAASVLTDNNHLMPGYFLLAAGLILLAACTGWTVVRRARNSGRPNQLG